MTGQQALQDGSSSGCIVPPKIQRLSTDKPADFKAKGYHSKSEMRRIECPQCNKPRNGECRCTLIKDEPAPKLNRVDGSTLDKSDFKPAPPAARERPRYFHVPVVKKDLSYGGYETMEACVAAHGTGQLVADHVLLDDVDDLTAKCERLERELAFARDGINEENIKLKFKVEKLQVDNSRLEHDIDAQNVANIAAREKAQTDFEKYVDMVEERTAERDQARADYQDLGKQMVKDTARIAELTTAMKRIIHSTNAATVDSVSLILVIEAIGKAAREALKGESK